MQKEDLLSYEAIIQGFQKAHPRGARNFEKIYSNLDSELFFALKSRQWHRFYIYKKIVRMLQRDFDPKFITYLVDETEKGKHLLRQHCKNIAELSRRDAALWKKLLDKKMQWTETSNA